MFVIDPSTQKIKLTKGDTATMLVQVFDIDGKAYTIQSTDVITMTLKKTASSEVALTKTATTEHYIIINHDDTDDLDEGLYIYDVQLTTASGYVYTIIPASYFQLTQEVTNA